MAHDEENSCKVGDMVTDPRMRADFQDASPGKSSTKTAAEATED